MVLFLACAKVGMVRHVQSDLKQQVKMNLGMKLIRKTYCWYEVDFLHVFRHTQMHLFDSVHLYGCGQA